MTVTKLLTRLVLMAVLLVTVSSFGLCNDYLRTADFDTVTVSARDSVWIIASRYTDREEDVRALAEAIIEVNGLPADGALRAGQSLQVPILRERLPKIARR